MAGKHSEQLRGILAVNSSALFQGRFGRMFRNIPPATFGSTDAENETNLHKLARAMEAGLDFPKDDPDAEESGIPALYTYFGQFVDHDITFDPMSSLIKQNDPAGLVDFRNPALDLDNVYGRGPSDQPYMYEPGGMKFLLGDPLTGGHPHARDLPRNSAGRALIGDPRNDENSIVSQLQGLFLHFHNRLVDEHPDASFEEIQQLLRFHYQYIVLNDFLPRIVSKSVLDDLKTNGAYDRSKMKFFHWKNDPFMPVEFSVAAYRLGHSMIRPGYRLNDNNLLPIFPIPRTRFATKGLTGFQPVAHGRAIDWGRFIDVDIRSYGAVHGKKKRLQLAYRIDPSFVHPLGTLPPAVVSDKPKSLGERNLVRGWRLQLPSGQDVARSMGLVPLADDKIMISKAVDVPDPADGPVLNIVQAAGKVFADNCPLWTYILAEAAQNRESVKIPVIEDISISTPKLGPVGGRIVAEVLLGLVFGDGASLLSRDAFWQPATGKNFTLKDFVNYALGRGPKL
jgi:hypothetical protein